MKKNSHSNKSSFGLIFALIALLAIGFAFGKEVLGGLLMCIAILVAVIFVSGVAIVLFLAIQEAIEERKKDDEKEPPYN